MLKEIIISSTLSIGLTSYSFANENQQLSQYSQNNPQELVRSIANETLSFIKNDRQLHSGDTKKLIQWANDNALVYFDFNKISSLALGKDWKLATSQQKIEISEQLKKLLTRTFANAFSGITINQTLEFKPLNFDENSTDVVVKSFIIKPSAKPIDINYSLYKSNEGWKIYDITVSGVSLVTNYRNSFTDEIRANGIDGLISLLKEKNDKLTNKS